MTGIDTGERDGRVGRGRKAPGRAARFRTRTRSVIRALREPTPLVLAAAGIVDALSGSPWSHGAMLVAVAALLGWDAVGRRRKERAEAAETLVPAGDAPSGAAVLAATPPTGAATRIGLTPAALIGGVLYAAVVGSFARCSWPPTVAVAGLGVAAMTLAWRTPPRGRPEPKVVEHGGAAAWATLFVVLGLWELANLLLQPSLSTGSYVHPTISVLTDPVLASNLGRSVFLAAWLGLGAFLLER